LELQAFWLELPLWVVFAGFSVGILKGGWGGRRPSRNSNWSPRAHHATQTQHRRNADSAKPDATKLSETRRNADAKQAQRSRNADATQTQRRGKPLTPQRNANDSKDTLDSGYHSNLQRRNADESQPPAALREPFDADATQTQRPTQRRRNETQRRGWVNSAYPPPNSTKLNETQRRPKATQSRRTDRNVARGAPWGAPGRRARL
jgi:hypothetical protein